MKLEVKRFRGMNMTMMTTPARAAHPKVIANMVMARVTWNGTDHMFWRYGTAWTMISMSTAAWLRISPAVRLERADGERRRILCRMALERTVW